MNDSVSRPSPPARRRWWPWLLLILVPLAIGGGRIWHVHRTAPAAYFQAGKAAFAADDLDAVEAAAQCLGGLEAYQPHRHLLEGMVLLRSGRLLEAVQQFVPANDHPDTQALAYALSGEALYKAKRYRDGLRILSGAIQLDPSNTDARRWLAALYYDIGMMDHAVEQLRVVAEQAPADPRPCRLRGLIYRDFEKYDAAIAEYRESMRRDPEQPDRQAVRVEWAECLLKQGRHEEALEVLQKTSPAPDALTLQAECYHAQGNPAEARKRLEEALRLAPRDLNALLLDAAIRFSANDAAGAARTLQKAAEYHPADYRVRYKLVQAYERLGRTKEALEQAKAMNELRQLRTRFSDLHNKAMTDSTSAELRCQLGELAGKLGKPDLAYSWYTAALALDPDYAPARQALGKLLREQTPQEPAGKRP